MGKPLLAAFSPPVTEQERSRLLELIPEIEWIGDPEMREQVIQVWVRAWRAGNWPDLAASPFLKDIPVERWSGMTHVRTVIRGCRAVAIELQEVNHLPVNFDELLTAAILHDAGKVVEIAPTASGMGLSEVGKVLTHATLVAQWALEAGLPASVAQAIYAHTPAVSAQPATVEGLILYYVDALTAEACRLVLGQKLHPKYVRPG